MPAPLFVLGLKEEGKQKALLLGEHTGSGFVRKTVQRVLASLNWAVALPPRSEGRVLLS